MQVFIYYKITLFMFRVSISHPSSGEHKTVSAPSGTGHSIWATNFLQRGRIPATLAEGSFFFFLNKACVDDHDTVQSSAQRPSERIVQQPTYGLLCNRDGFSWTW